MPWRSRRASTMAPRCVSRAVAQLVLAVVPMATCTSTFGSGHTRPFRREGNDLVHDFYIPFTQAVLGAELEYETLDGSETFVVPRATESGTEFRMRGRGVPHVRGRGRGDLRVRVFVDVPDELPEEQEQLLREFAARRGEDVAEPGQGLLGRIKSAFS